MLEEVSSQIYEEEEDSKEEKSLKYQSLNK